jgi:NDP-4-keto-2,6-dideoxyhexose 3-C-methyltransferase
MYRKITKCRVCGNSDLVSVLDLGEQYLTGIFPHKIDLDLTKGPLRLVKCANGKDSCGLLQLEHSYDPDEMYGENYGYHSSLNASMVRHLKAKVERIQGLATLNAGDLVIDIGANDGTTLGFYPEDLLLVGIDPTGAKFKEFYKPHVKLIADFFNAKLVREAFPGRKAKVISSFSMLYDLEDPIFFFQEIAQILDEDGIWVTEQSYMPLMLDRNSYDTVCHEHLEYYGLHQLCWIADKAGLKVIDVELNEINGGSFSLTLVHKSSPRTDDGHVQKILDEEKARGLDGLKPYQEFAQRVAACRTELQAFLADARKNGKTIYGLGASTKGNVLLQYCGLTTEDIPAIGEVNPDKFGSYAPGTWIPIQNEKDILAKKPDYLLVLPWHFREFFVGSKMFSGRDLVFPLPKLEIVKPA